MFGLTESDKEWLREMVREELKTALFRKITVERGPRQNGDPEKVIKEEEWNVLDFLAVYLPKIEGSLRGVQSDVDRSSNKVSDTNLKLQAVADVLIGMEKPLKTICGFADQVRQLAEGSGLQIAESGVKDESGS